MMLILKCDSVLAPILNYKTSFSPFLNLIANVLENYAHLYIVD